MLKKSGLYIVAQITAVLILLCLPLFIISDQGFENIFTSKVLISYLLFCLCYVGIYLIHSLILFPKLYAKANYGLYFGALIVLFLAIVFFRPFDRLIFENRKPRFFHPSNPAYLDKKFEMRPPPPQSPDFRRGPRIDIAGILLYFLIVLISISRETNRLLVRTTQRALLAESEKTQAELSFLKAQVNPHFLFNTLNNIYTLAIIKDNNTATSIMKLSNIMRYITDEAVHDFVNLEEEINCIKDFIALQNLRLSKKTTVIFETKGNFENKKIAPLILMAFVENVFKYGISNHNSSTLIININTQNDILNLFCQNPIFPDKKMQERNGIGLDNTKQRLQYHYPDKHILDISDKKQVFTVKLTIHIS